MRLYLVQHGEALSKEQDPARPLSPAGRDDLVRMAAHLEHAGVRAQRLIHSGKTRAEQTASILGARVAPQQTLETVAWLQPKDSSDELVAVAQRLSADLMVVGHQPFMGRCVARLLAGSEERLSVDYAPGTVVCLARDEAGEWQLEWMLRPELVI